MESIVNRYEEHYKEYKALHQKYENAQEKKNRLEEAAAGLKVRYEMFRCDDTTLINQKIREYKEELIQNVEAEAEAERKELTEKINQLKQEEMDAERAGGMAYEESKRRLQVVLENREQATANIEEIIQWIPKNIVRRKIEQYDQNKIDFERITEKKLLPVRFLLPRAVVTKLGKLVRILLWPSLFDKKLDRKKALLAHFGYLIGLILLISVLAMIRGEYLPPWTAVKIYAIKPLMIVAGIAVAFLAFQYAFAMMSLNRNLDIYSSVFNFEALVELIGRRFATAEQEAVISKCRQQRAVYEKKLIRVLQEKKNRLEEIENQDYQNIREETMEKLRTEYRNLGKELEKKRQEADKLEEQLKQQEKQQEGLREQLEEEEKKLAEPMKDKARNQGVVTPSFFVEFTEGEFGTSPKELHAIHHNWKPVLILYDGERKASHEEEFSENATALITKFIAGILVDNHYSIAKMSLVDFETGGARFPAQQTNGILTIYKNTNEFSKLVKLLEEASTVVHHQGNGKIRDINPQRIADRNHPLPFHFLFLYGYDYGIFDRNMMQLYKNGELFGMIPIIFLSADIYHKIQNRETVATDAFREAVNGIPEENCYWFDFGRVELRQYNKTKEFFGGES